MPEASPHIVVLGAGHAGGRAVEAMRAAGFDGAITMVGAETYLPYERPALSKELLAGRTQLETILVQSMAWYEENRITLRLDCAVEAIDRRAQRLRLPGSQSLAYDQLLIATGARARRLPVAPPDADIFYIRTLDDSLRLAGRLRSPCRVLVVGSGFIGLEVAATARQMGCAVTVVSDASEPLRRVAPAPIGRRFAALHEANGVLFHHGVLIEAIKRRGRCLHVSLSDGGTVETDIAVVGIGAEPNVELARDAGLDVDDGILVDEFGGSSDPAVFAAGDVCRFFHPVLGRHLRLETWQNAQNQAIAVARSMTGNREPCAELPWFWTDQYDTNYQSAGVFDAGGEIVWRGDPAGSKWSAFFVADGRVTGGACFNNARDMRFIRQLGLRRAVADPALADPAFDLRRLKPV